MRPLSRIFALVGLGAAACATSSATSGLVPLTGLSVDPAEFMNGVACAASDGGASREHMVAYVATIFDVSPFDMPGSRIHEGLLESRDACYPAERCLELPSSEPSS